MDIRESRPIYVACFAYSKMLIYKLFGDSTISNVLLD